MRNSMLRKRTILLGILLLLGATGSQGQPGRPPNFLFIAVDDLKPLLGCFGDTLAITPHMDAIAARGLTFTNTYCQQAVCAPSRASLMSSRYPDQTRVWDLETQMREMDPGLVTLPQYLRQKGYRTAGTGKIYDSRSVDEGHDTPSWSVPFRKHWDARYYNAETGKPAYFYAAPHARDTIALLQAEAIQQGVDPLTYVKARYFPATENADVPLDAYADGAIANAGIELLEEAAASGDPFFLAIGFHRPHLPFNAPAPFWDLYDRDQFPLAPFQQQAAGSPSLAYHNSNELRDYTGIPENGILPEDVQRELIHGYYAATSYIDSLIGQVMGKLEVLGLQENTVIVLWGDHGWHLGDHQLWCKHSNFEEATHAPLVISYPGQPNMGAHSRALTEFTDIAPTICDLAGLPIPAFFEGESLMGIFRDTLSTVREGALSQYPRNGKMGYSLRTSRYRYTRWTNPDGSLYARELYDYQEDPLESVNLAADAGYAEVTGQLEQRVVERIAVPSTQERITFQVMGTGHGSDTVKIHGASLHFGQETRQTDENGVARYTHVTGPTGFRADAQGYMTLDGILEVKGDTLVTLFLQQEEPTFDASFRLSDLHSGRPLMGASIVLEGTEQITDLSGVATFVVTAGAHAFTIEKENYPLLGGEVTIAGDTAFGFRLEATHAEVKIWLREGTTPVNLATVLLGDRQVVSNALGISRFDRIPTGLPHPFLVEKEGFLPIEGSLVPLADTSLHFQMERWTLDQQLIAGPGLRIWPNPARAVLHLDVSGQKAAGRLEITDLQGRVLLEQLLAGPHLTLLLERFPPGLYRIRYSSGQNTLVGSFLKIE